jgi:hypothetical protein
MTVITLLMLKIKVLVKECDYSALVEIVMSITDRYVAAK